MVTTDSAHRLPVVPNLLDRRFDSWQCIKTLKVERVHQVRYDTRTQARLDIVNWIEGWYNRKRLHSANGFLPPVIWERESPRLAA